MANPGRVPGKRGANRRDYAQPVPFFEDYLTGSPADLAVAAPSGTIDWFSKVTDWPMYCNGPDRLILLQPDFVMFMVAWLAAGSGRFLAWRW
jgi:hypothetical protein